LNRINGFAPWLTSKRIAGSGGVYFFDDDRQWPDTQQMHYEYETPAGPRMLIYEHRLWILVRAED
jgi:hypothetical protein